MAFDGTDFPVTTVFLAEDKLTGPLNSIASAIDRKLDVKLGRTAEIAGKVTKKIAGVAVSLAKIGGAGVVGGVGLAVKKFADLDDSVRKIQTLLPPGIDAMQEFGDVINRNAVKFGKSQAEVAESVFQAISGGIAGTSEAVETFQQTAGKAAVGGFTDMIGTTNLLLTVMDNYGVAVEDVASVSDKLFAINKIGRTDVDQLSKTLGRILPIAAGVGVSFEDVGTAVAVMTRGGVKTNEVVTSLTALLGGLKTPTDKAIKAAKDLGIEFGLDAIKDGGGLVPFLNKIALAGADNKKAVDDLFGSMNAYSVLMKTTSVEGMRATAEAMEEIQNSAGKTDKAFGDATGGIQQKMRQLKSLMDVALSSAGGGFLEGLGFDTEADPTQFTQRVIDAATDVGKTIGEVAGAIGDFLGGIDWDVVVSGFKIAWNTIKGVFAGIKVFIKASIAALAVAITLALAPVLIPLTAIGALAALAMGEWDAFGEFFEDLWDGIVEFLEASFEDIKDVLTGIQDVVSVVTFGLVDSAEEDARQEREDPDRIREQAKFNRDLEAARPEIEALGSALAEKFSGLTAGLGFGDAVDSPDQNVKTETVLRFEGLPEGAGVEQVKGSSDPDHTVSVKGRRNMPDGGL